MLYEDDSPGRPRLMTGALLGGLVLLALCVPLAVVAVVANSHAPPADPKPLAARHPPPAPAAEKPPDLGKLIGSSWAEVHERFGDPVAVLPANGRAGGISAAGMTQAKVCHFRVGDRLAVVEFAADGLVSGAYWRQ